jgi:hypothetical protein
MYKIFGVACTVLLSVAALAQTEVATVTSITPFTLRGAGITPGQGVPMWPVLAGDKVAAGTSMTILTFPDASVVTLAPGSEGKVDFVNGTPVFQLLSGTARYSVKSITAVQLMEASLTVTPTSLTGTLTLGRNRGGAAAAAGFWTAGHVAAVAIVAGAAAAGTGYAVNNAVNSGGTNGGVSISPSK